MNHEASPLSDPCAELPLVEVQGLSKCFRLYSRPAHLLKELLLRKPCHVERWALRDVSFSVRRGEIVGVVGGNGAGKSTLLKILAGVLDSTHGAVHLRGRLRAILELGTGFHDDYTAMENIFMGGYCLGYTRKEIEESLEWIIDFAGLREVIHAPFRTFSSGMKARLTFAVTFCRKPEILIVDEALAVGDLGFTAKCVNRITELCSAGATALVVSHNMFFIERLCTRAIYIKKGQLLEDGPPAPICKRYETELLDEFTKQQEQERAREAVAGVPNVPELSSSEIQRLVDDPQGECPPILHLNLLRLEETRVLDRHGLPRQQFHVGEPVTLEFVVNSRVAKDNIVVGMQIFHESGVHVLTTNNRWHLTQEGRPAQVRLDLREGRQVFSVAFPHMYLGDGKYYVNIAVLPKEKHFTQADCLLLEKRVATLGFARDDTSYKQICDLPSSWRQEHPAGCIASRKSA
jgi:ABC-type polysaccharide/polyol phosphate transport system ATPase subunit